MKASYSAFYHHGGRIGDAREAFPSASQPWIDLSTGINPHPWSSLPAMTEENRFLPDPSVLRDLETAAAMAFAADPSGIITFPGAESALRLLPFFLKCRSAGIVSPTYGSHEAAWYQAGADIRLLPSSAVETDDSEALVIVNPNNPDGRAFDRQLLLDIGKTRSSRGLWTIIDESFVDPIPELSVADEVTGRTIVIRSFGKFFGLPGLRLGFLLAHPEIAAELRHLTGDWPVSQQALITGLAAYRDLGWQQAMRQRLAADIRRLETLLTGAGFRRIGGTPLFTLMHSEQAADWFVALARSGILTRPFSFDRNRLRFGIPDGSGWERLEQVLERGIPAGCVAC